MVNDFFGGMMKKKCVFCKGTGKDQFRLLSKSSTCQVCQGSGIVEVSEHAVKCVYCDGAGVYPGTRLTCTVCFGKGLVTLGKGQLVVCSTCKGSGRAAHSGLYCLKCGGTGKISNE